MAGRVVTRIGDRFERLAYRGEERTTAALVLEEAAPINGWPRIRLAVTVEGVTHEAVAHDAFEALTVVRRAIERDGWLLGVQGAREDVWPSGTARDQGRGMRAYRIRRGVAARSEDLVDVFARASALLTTVARQERAARRWLRGPFLRGPIGLERPHDDIELSRVTSGPCPDLAPRRRTGNPFARAPRPDARTQWQIARDLLGDALTPTEWDEAELLSHQYISGLSGRPGLQRLVTAVGSDDDGVRWSDLVDLDVDADGSMSVRRFRRRYVHGTAARIDVLFDTRAEGLPPTEFRESDLRALGGQEQLGALDRFLRDQGLVPEAALYEMFWPDRGRVPTGEDRDQPPNCSFSGPDGQQNWTVEVGATGHLRITRATPTGGRAPRLQAEG